MNENVKLKPGVHPEIKDEMIDQISIINGYIRIVLLRYPGDKFLTECLSKILVSADLLTEQVLGVGEGPAAIIH